MNDSPPPPPPPPPSADRRRGTVVGCLAVPAAVVVGIAVAVGASDSAFPVYAVPVVLVAVALVAGRRMPGFLRGALWAIGIGAVVFTACVAALSGTSF